MSKKKLFFVIAVAALVCLATSVFANTAIKLYFNGEELETDVPPTLINHRVLVPIRVISEAYGMNVEWKDNAVYVESESGSSNTRIRLLEEALAPKDALSAARTWAEGVKMRNGALQFAVMSPDLREEKYSHFVELDWVTGTSSPWIKDYTIKEISRSDNDIYRYEIEFTYTDSTQIEFTKKEYIIVKNFESAWLVSSIERIDVKGEITKITYDENNKISSIFVENTSAEKEGYDKATVFIGSETKIYRGYTDTELTPDALKKGSKVEVTFTDDPMIMIYPPQAMARVIRVIYDVSATD
jgi:hypothetical protein